MVGESLSKVETCKYRLSKQIGSYFRNQSKIEITIIVILAAVALALRTINLTGYPVLALDEGQYAQNAWNIFHGIWGDKVWAPDFFPPLYPVLLGLLEIAFGRGYDVTRMLGAILGTISVVVVYLLAKKMYNRFVGISAALILSVAGLYINRMVLLDNGVELFFLLTIFAYVKSRENNSNMWIWLAGIFAGLSFLSKYQGVISIIFLILISIVHKNGSMIKKGLIAFVGMSLFYPLIGLVENWNGFVYDLLYQAMNRGVLIGGANSVDQGLAIFMYGLFAGKYLYPPYIFTLLGFLSVFYVAAIDDSEKIFPVAIVSGFLVFVINPLIWWSYLIIIFPLFSLAIAILINDIVNQRKNWLLSFLLFLIVSVPMFISVVNLQSTFQKDVILASFVFVVLLSVVSYVNEKFNILSKFSSMRRLKNIDFPKINFTKMVLIIILITILVGSSFYDIGPIMLNQNSDEYKVAQFLNTHASKDDIVGVDTSFLPALNAFGVNYQLILLNTTHDDLYLFPAELLSRFNYNVSIDNVKYMVLGSQWFDFEGLQTQRTVAVSNMILRSWVLVFSSGQYLVFLNPSFALEASRQIIADSMSSGWHLAYASGNNNKFNTTGGIGTFTTTAFGINQYVFWTINLTAPISEYQYFVIRYKANTPEMRVIVKFLNSSGDEIGRSQSNPQSGWFTQNSPPTSFTTVVCNISSLFPQSMNSTVSAIVVGMDSLNNNGFTYRLDLDFVGFLGYG